MLHISKKVSIPYNEIEISAIKAGGPGGQNINKVSTAIHLRFDVKASSLPDFYKERLFFLSNQHISKDGIIIIKAQRYRTQEANKEDALNRLHKLIKKAITIRKKRKPTTPTQKSKEKRIEHKKKHSTLKGLRKKIEG